MSSTNLKKFLTKLDKELQRNSENYRTAVTNKKYHVFTYKSTDLRNTLKLLLDKSTSFDNEGREILRNVREELNPLITKLTKNIRKEFENIAAASNKTVRVRNIRGGVTVTVFEFEGKKGQRDNFKLIQNAYKKYLDAFYQDFLKILGKPILRKSKSAKGGKVNVGTAGQAFNLEHYKGASNIEMFINDAVHAALQNIYKTSDITGIKKELKQYQLETVLQIHKKVKQGKVEVKLGSQLLNVIQSKEEQGLKRDLTKQLRNAIQKLDVVNLEGSDSLLDGQRKKVIKTVVTPFKKSKNLTVKHEKITVKESGPATLRKKPKVRKNTKTQVPLVRKRKLEPREGDNRRSMFAIMAMINQKLPQTVEKNMGAPGLENRTGRFARSVKLTDVSATRQNFPSFGYTYDKEPYQVFEIGRGRAPWATPERDPRKVIDASVRELAAEMAIGRFYTRRV